MVLPIDNPMPWIPFDHQFQHFASEEAVAEGRDGSGILVCPQLCLQAPQRDPPMGLTVEPALDFDADDIED